MARIYKNNGTGKFEIGYAGMDLDQYTIPETSEVIAAIDAADTWDAFDPEFYRAICEELGVDYDAVDYDAYEDPDELFAAMEKAANEKQ